MTARRSPWRRGRTRPEGVPEIRAAMTEDDLLIGLIGDGRRPGALQRAGFLVHHIRRADLAQQMGDPGFPDIVAAHVNDGRLIVVELKSDRGRFEPGQPEWLAAFRAAGVDTREIWPEDYDALIEELTGDRLVARGRR